MTPRGKSAAGLAGWLAAAYAAAAIGGLGSRDAGALYAALTLPAWAPPGWLFGPVWTVLYTLMGVAAWRVWREHGFAGARAPLWLFLAQLVPNALWSWLFFAWRLGGPALADIAVLCGLVLATTALFWRANRLAGALLLPYLAWIGFAAVLNYSLWRLNAQALGG